MLIASTIVLNLTGDGGAGATGDGGAGATGDGGADMEDDGGSPKFTTDENLQDVCGEVERLAVEEAGEVYCGDAAARSQEGMKVYPSVQKPRSSLHVQRGEIDCNGNINKA
jgi:hypothetical protein